MIDITVDLSTSVQVGKLFESRAFEFRDKFSKNIDLKKRQAVGFHQSDNLQCGCKEEASK